MHFRSVGGAKPLPHIRECKRNTLLVKGNVFGGYMKNIAVQGCQLDCSFAQIMTSPKTSVKYGGKATYAGDLTIQISGYSSSVITVAGSGSGSDTLHPTSQHVKIDGEKVVLEGDKVTITVNGKAYAGQSTIDVSEPVTVTITNAGQTYGKGE